MTPKNGRVSNADLYKALLDMTTHFDNRLDGLSESLNERCSGLDERISVHENMDHTDTKPSNMKTGGIAGAVSILLVAAAALIERLLGKY